MAERREASPDSSLTFQQQKPKEGEAAAATSFTPAERSFWQNMIQLVGSPEPLQDPVYYPAYALSRTEDFIQNGRLGPDGRLQHEEERATITPMFESIRKIKTAYQILVHPRCDDQHRHAIEGDLARERNWYDRDRAELTGKEAMILTALAQTTGVPADPDRRTFLHSEVLRS